MGRRCANLDNSKLYNLYVVNNYTTKEISRKLSVSQSTVQNYLKKYNIQIKGMKYFGQNKRIVYDECELDFFDGLIISDGSIVVKKDKTGKRLGNNQVSCAFKHKEFAEYINDTLKFGSKIGIKVVKNKRYKHGVCVSNSLMSPCNVFFTEQRDRWYPRGTKLIPDDFRFSRVSMNIAYLGDGHLSKNKGFIVLSTQSFSKSNLNNTIVKHLHDVGVDCHVAPNNTIFIPKSSVKIFVDFIGPCPIQCYKYKWGL